MLSAEDYSSCTESTIVVIDDDDDIREVVREALHAEGYPTVGASNGQDALDLLHAAQEHPRLILLDLMMPVMDGWDFLLNINTDPELSQIPVGLMSAHPSIRRAFDGYQQKYGFTRLLLPKPLDMTRLLSMVRSVCSACSASASVPEPS
jgi:two-component system chemotaxis response regulator CheY